MGGGGGAYRRAKVFLSLPLPLLLQLHQLCDSSSHQVAQTPGSIYLFLSLQLQGGGGLRFSYLWVALLFPMNCLLPVYLVPSIIFSVL